MIIVSINTANNFYEINLSHRMTMVNLSGELTADKNSHLKTVKIFTELFKGVLIILKRKTLSLLAGEKN